LINNTNRSKHNQYKEIYRNTNNEYTRIYNLIEEHALIRTLIQSTQTHAHAHDTLTTHTDTPMYYIMDLASWQLNGM